MEGIELRKHLKAIEKPDRTPMSCVNQKQHGALFQASSIVAMIFHPQIAGKLNNNGYALNFPPFSMISELGTEKRGFIIII